MYLNIKRNIPFRSLMMSGVSKRSLSNRIKKVSWNIAIFCTMMLAFKKRIQLSTPFNSAFLKSSPWSSLSSLRSQNNLLMTSIQIFVGSCVMASNFVSPSLISRILSFVIFPLLYGCEIASFVRLSHRPPIADIVACWRTLSTVCDASSNESMLKTWKCVCCGCCVCVCAICCCCCCC